MRLNQRWFVWIILSLCILAIPVAVLTQTSSTGKETKGGTNSLLAKFKDKIEVIHLSGMIIDKTDVAVFSSSTGSASSALKALRKALKEEKVKAVLLRINSPGGTVPTSQELHAAVMDLRQAGKPVVVSMGDMAASGGYYVACAADRIYANSGTLTGSIGVIINLMNFKGLADKLGVEPEVIKTGLFKDIASPYRKMTPEDKAILQALILDSYEQFTGAIADGRKLPIEEVKRIADGRIYSGRQALKLKLVDEIGTYTDALAGLQKICREKYKLSTDLGVEDNAADSFFSKLMETSAGAGAPSLSIEKCLPASLSPSLARQPLWLAE